MLMQFPNGLDERRIRLIRHRLAPVLKTTFGYHALSFGGLCERFGMSGSPIKNIHFIEQDQNHYQRMVSNTKGLIADYSQLPIASDSVDLVMLPAVLQQAENPHAILREVERVLIPEGKVIIIGRNPLSWQGIAQQVRRLAHPQMRKSGGQDISRLRLKDWLMLLGLELDEEIGVSLNNEKIQLGKASRLSKRISNYFCDYFCSYFILVAQKKVSTLTPIRPSWRKNKRLVPPRVAEPSVRAHTDKWCVDKNS